MFFNIDHFDFDATLNIVGWYFALVPDGAQDNENIIATSSDFGDSTRTTSANGGSTRVIDTWTAPAIALPEPASLALVALALAGAGIASRLRKT